MSRDSRRRVDGVCGISAVLGSGAPGLGGIVVVVVVVVGVSVVVVVVWWV